MKILGFIIAAVLIFSLWGCGETSEQILQPETPPEMSENSERATGDDAVPAAPPWHAPLCLPEPLMCMEWHELSQSQRNQKILERAYKDLHQKTKECKAWVQDVVYSASNGDVYPPITDMNHKDRWIDDPEKTDSEYCIGRCASIRSAKPGEIVQLRWKESYVPLPNNLHTFIVVSVNASTITVIDSNAENRQIVSERELPISDFDGSDDAKVDSFSIYTIR